VRVGANHYAIWDRYSTGTGTPAYLAIIDRQYKIWGLLNF
jgi:hypothetical protein